MNWQARRLTGGMSLVSAFSISAGVILPSWRSISFSFSCMVMPICAPSALRVTRIRHDPHSPSPQSNGIGILYFLARARMLPRAPAIA